MTFLLDDSLGLDDIGYTDLKSKLLRNLYLHEESRDAALHQWRKRKGHDPWRQRKGKFLNVAFHCFNHTVKRSGLDGEQGPCLLSVTVTDTERYTRQGGSYKREVVANIAYRSTEFFKKFPADLIFIRDVLLQPFEVTGGVTFHLANVTVHPLYFPNLIPLLNDPVSELRDLQQRDGRFWRIVIRQSTDLLCGGKTNAKFAQAQRVKRHVLERIDPVMLKDVRAYLKSTQIGAFVLTQR
jgi:hypothetical protein